MDNLVEIGQQVIVSVLGIIGIILSIIYGVNGGDPESPLMSSQTDTGSSIVVDGVLPEVENPAPGSHDNNSDSSSTVDGVPPRVENPAPGSHNNNPDNNPDNNVHRPGAYTKPAPNVPDANNMQVVNQGDRIAISRVDDPNRLHVCTIAYVDQEHNRAYTAAHCAGRTNSLGHRIDLGQTVYKCDASSRGVLPNGDLSCRNYKEVGKIHYAGRYLGGQQYDDNHIFTTQWGEDISFADMMTDIAVLDLAPGTHAGQNIISGNNIVKYSEVTENDQLCFYGSASDNLVCGFVRDYRGVEGFRNYTIGGNTPSINGDSGGIVYIPGKGAYGVVSGRVQWGSDIEGMDTVPAAFNRS